MDGSGRVHVALGGEMGIQSPEHDATPIQTVNLRANLQPEKRTKQGSGFTARVASSLDLN